MKKFTLFCICSTLFLTFEVEAGCQGKFLNPVSDICWRCLFPITIGGMKVAGQNQEDTPNPHQLICLCPRPPLPLPVPGIPISFWEPVRLVDVTRTPYCLVNMGGIQIAGNSNNLQGRGSVSTNG